MKYKRPIFLLLFAGMAFVMTAGITLLTAVPAQAQCGSQASSCKSCHEVQGQMPVNSDGTGWHQSHAFGDFCYICHAGNNQATDKTAAHEGMVAPLADINTSCLQCHPTDLQESAQVYASALGVELGAGEPAGDAPGDTGQPPAPAPVEAGAEASAGQECTSITVDDPNVVNYAQSYDEIVLGKKPVNWGNSILGAMIVLMLVGGGGFVITREKLVKISFGDTDRDEEQK